MKLKVCGMCSPENIMALSNFNPDYIGFVFGTLQKVVISFHA